MSTDSAAKMFALGSSTTQIRCGEFEDTVSEYNKELHLWWLTGRDPKRFSYVSANEHEDVSFRVMNFGPDELSFESLSVQGHQRRGSIPANALSDELAGVILSIWNNDEQAAWGFVGVSHVLLRFDGWGNGLEERARGRPRGTGGFATPFYLADAFISASPPFGWSMIWRFGEGDPARDIVCPAYQYSAHREARVLPYTAKYEDTRWDLRRQQFWA